MLLVSKLVKQVIMIRSPKRTSTHPCIILQRNMRAVMRIVQLLGTLSPFILVLLTACGDLDPRSDSPSEDNITVAANPFENKPSDSSATNITDAIFVARNADCADYAKNTYYSKVMDVNRRLGFDGKVNIVVNADTCTLSSNNIPNHNFDDRERPFPNNVAEVDRQLVLYRNPVLAAAKTELSQRSWDAIMLNGVVVDRLSAGCWDENRKINVRQGCNTQRAEWLIDPLGSDGFFAEDSHNAHAQPDGSYHYHGNPNAMFNDDPGPNGSPVVGFAADGFPIYGSYFLDPKTGQVRKAKSGYTLKSGTRPSGPGGTYDGFYVQDWEFTDSGDLDGCNGMTVDGQYGYYVTDTYPWILNCLSGKPHDSFRKR